MGGGREEQRKQDTRGRTEEVETKSDRKHTHTQQKNWNKGGGPVRCCEHCFIVVSHKEIRNHIQKAACAFIFTYKNVRDTEGRAQEPSFLSHTHTHREHSRKSNYVDKVNKHTVKTKFCL